MKELAEQEVPWAEIATQYGVEILAVKALPDHMHLFVSAPPKFAPAEIIRLFQGITLPQVEESV